MRLARALVLSTALLLLGATPSFAATEIGQLPPVYEAGFCAGSASVQTAIDPGTTPYTAPTGGGVITSWQTKTGPGAGTTKLKVYRATGNLNEYLIVGEDGPRPVAAQTSPTFTSGVRIPVEAGDVIGLTGLGTNCTSYLPGSQYALVNFGLGVDPAPGTTATATSGGPDAALEVKAMVEADADKDGYGDESQDACPADASAQVAPCPAPTSPSVPDTTAPQLTLSGKAVQDALKQGGVKVTAKTSEGSTLAAKGSVSIPRAGKSFSLVPAAAQAQAGVGVTLKLGVSKAARKKIKKALAAGKRVRSNVHVTAKDAAGNASSANQAVRIKRKRS